MKSLYLIHALGTDKYKIGTSCNPSCRIRSLQTASASRLEILATMPGNEQRERELHAILQPHRLVGEWFQFDHSSTTLRLLVDMFRVSGGGHNDTPQLPLFT